MGTDVWTESGIIKTTSALCQLITDKNFPVIFGACKRFAIKKKDQNILDPIFNLESIDRDSFVEVLIEITESKDNQDDLDGVIFDLWNIIVKKSNPKLPKIQQIKVFDNPRECGWNVPIDEPCFLFSDDGMYKKVLTKKGKTFKKFLGECDETTWSVMSY